MDNTKKEAAEKALKLLDELEEEEELENIVKDNKIEFVYKDITYRLRKPTPQEQREISKFRRGKFNEYLNDSTYYMKQQLIDKYKAKGLDIDKLTDEIQTITNEIQSTMLKLAEVQDDKNVNNFKSRILKLKQQQLEKATERSNYLSYSIEDQLLADTITYTSFIVFEKQVGDKWEQFFKEYKKFEDYEEVELTNTAISYLSCLINFKDFNDV